jgi:DNA-binding CsgD family transcriptional regulator
MAGADGLPALTPQQRRIVQLAVQGLSNREIAQRLVLSHRTVASHLYRCFPKLGVAERRQLHDLMYPPRRHNGRRDWTAWLASSTDSPLVSGRNR